MSGILVSGSISEGQASVPVIVPRYMKPIEPKDKVGVWHK